MVSKVEKTCASILISDPIERDSCLFFCFFQTFSVHHDLTFYSFYETRDKQLKKKVQNKTKRRMTIETKLLNFLVHYMLFSKMFSPSVSMFYSVTVRNRFFLSSTLILSQQSYCRFQTNAEGRGASLTCLVKKITTQGERFYWFAIFI